MQFVQDHGFRLIDTNLKFEKRAESPTAVSGDCLLRFAEPADRDAVMDLARRNFVFTRFHLDELIPNSVADEIKAQWAANFFSGQRGDRLVVAELDKKIVGFTLLLVPTDSEVVIDLIAVDDAYRRRGIAAEMIAFVESQFAPAQLVVGTQAANLPSVRLYEKLGFRLAGISTCFISIIPRLACHEGRLVRHRPGRAGCGRNWQ